MKERAEKLTRGCVFPNSTLILTAPTLNPYLVPCRAKQERLMSPTTPTPTLQDAPHPSPQSADSHVTKSPDSCRVQVRLPDGGVVRHTFPPSATLGSVVEVVRERAPHLSHILLVQVRGRVLVLVYI